MLFFAYFLILLLAFTLFPLITLLLRLILITFLSGVYMKLPFGKNPQSVLNFAVKIAQPMGFITSLLHGYLSVWFGVVLLSGMSGKGSVDLFLPLLLGVAFVWFGTKQLKSPADVKVNNNIEFRDGQQTIVLNPDEKNDQNEQEDFIFNDELKEKIKANTMEFFKGNTIVGLIGKLTGLALATMSLIPF
jgi:hypothetical protein